MNKNFLLAAFCGFAIFSLQGAQAQPMLSPEEAEAAAKAAGINEPCTTLRDACKNAGFVLNGKNGNDVWMNCIKDTIEGKKIANLKTNPQQISSCKTELDNLPCMQVLKVCQNAGYTSGQPGKLTLFDCVFPLTQGKQVEGVNPKATDLASCKTFVDKVIQMQPCLRVMLACRKAGFSPDVVNGSKFATQCLVPVTEGKKVPGVIIDTATTSECYAKMHPGAVPSQSTQQITY